MGRGLIFSSIVARLTGQLLLGGMTTTGSSPSWTIERLLWSLDRLLSICYLDALIWICCQCAFSWLFGLFRVRL